MANYYNEKQKRIPKLIMKNKIKIVCGKNKIYFLYNIFLLIFPKYS